MSRLTLPTTFSWGPHGPWHQLLFQANLKTDGCPAALARPFDDSG
jgi:hypothetical protein